MHSVYTVYNSKNCLPKSTNAKKKKKKSRKRELINVDAEPKRLLRLHLDSLEVAFASAFSFFFFFFTRFGECSYCSINSSYKCWLFNYEQCICALFMDPQISLFSNFFIKNGSYGTIYTFKNYFATVFLIFSFQFQQNKFYPNIP